MFKFEEVDDLHLDYPISVSTRLVQKTQIQECMDQEFIQGKTYNLRVTMGVKFKCRPAHYSEALKEAKKNMLCRMYGPMIAELQEIRSAAYTEDPREIITICNRMQNTIMGEGL
jgi:hypothetical protein